MSVILVTHNMQHLVEIAHRVVVMRLGRTIAYARHKRDLCPGDSRAYYGAVPPDAVRRRG